MMRLPVPATRLAKKVILLSFPSPPMLPSVASLLLTPMSSQQPISSPRLHPACVPIHAVSNRRPLVFVSGEGRFEATAANRCSYERDLVPSNSRRGLVCRIRLSRLLATRNYRVHPQDELWAVFVASRRA